MVPELSIVIPVYNEEDVLPLLVRRLRPVADSLDLAYEIVAVDDGSTDQSPVVLQRILREWPELRVVRLRANAGHQAAISAGLASARGAHVVTLDADLQDPPEVIPEMVAAARQGVDVVYGVRTDRSSDSLVQARQRPRLLPPHPAHVRHARRGRCRGLPADVARHDRRRERPAGAPPRPAVRRAGARVPPPRGSSTDATSAQPASRSTRSPRW
ncbi:glycosyltransferase family 2 protein [Nostocoides sp. HKS02]|uniref:glycosyltransferase family 2 protein n=1 Tax=Nostocoides sp. HKS02 TaxID=1813880 RepID=UPI001E430FCB|nr:glycosyltransferase family 2 protein [Tetrasphaera sp. HKS02]